MPGNNSPNETHKPISIPTGDGESVSISCRPVYKDQLTQEAEERGIPRARLVKMYLQAGRMFYDLHHPTEGEVKSTHDGGADTIHSMIPKGEENAISIEELLDKIEDDILDIIGQDDEIKRDGWEVYR
jgi:hypothetical protein